MLSQKLSYDLRSLREVTPYEMFHICPCDFKKHLKRGFFCLYLRDALDKFSNQIRKNCKIGAAKFA